MNAAPSDKGSGFGSGASSGSGSWTQPKPDAKGTCPVVENWSDQAAMEKAKLLRKAMKGMGCDKKMVAEVTGSMNANQRVQVRHAFRTVDQAMKGMGCDKKMV